MIAYDIVHLLSSSANVAAYVAALVLLGGLVSGVVALGIMQTEIRAKVQTGAFWSFFFSPNFRRYSKVKYSDPIQNPESQYVEKFMRDFIDARGPLLFNLHYRQIAGQLLAITTNESRRAGESKVERPLTLTRAILVLKASGDSDISSYPYPYPEYDDELEISARWIDLLQGALGRAVARTVLWGTTLVWSAFLFINLIDTVAGSRFWQAMLDGPTFVFRLAAALNVLLLAVVATVIALTLALAIAAASLFTFTLLDKVVGAR